MAWIRLRNPNFITDKLKEVGAALKTAKGGNGSCSKIFGHYVAAYLVRYWYTYKADGAMINVSIWLLLKEATDHVSLSAALRPTAILRNHAL